MAPLLSETTSSFFWDSRLETMVKLLTVLVTGSPEGRSSPLNASYRTDIILEKQRIYPSPVHLFIHEWKGHNSPDELYCNLHSYFYCTKEQKGTINTYSGIFYNIVSGTSVDHHRMLITNIPSCYSHTLPMIRCDVTNIIHLYTGLSKSSRKAKNFLATQYSAVFTSYLWSSHRYKHTSMGLPHSP